MIRVLVVALYASVRAGLGAMLSADDSMAVVGEASGAAEVEELLRLTAPDAIVLDLDEASGSVLRLASRDRVPVVAIGEGAADLRAMISAPLAGWALLNRDAERPELVGALYAAVAGLAAVEQDLVPVALPVSDPLETSDALSPRELEVIALMAEGLPNKQIARRLSVSPHTAKFHVASILQKLGAESRTEAVTTGVRRGLVAL